LGEPKNTKENQNLILIRNPELINNTGALLFKIVEMKVEGVFFKTKKHIKIDT
jgi:hypothetical protein